MEQGVNTDAERRLMPLHENDRQTGCEPVFIPFSISTAYALCEIIKKSYISKLWRFDLFYTNGTPDLEDIYDDVGF